MTLRWGIPLLVASLAAFAHHAYTVQFDTSKPIKLTGVLTKVEWSNRHIWIYLDVKDDKGNTTNWGFSAPRQACSSAAAFPKTP